MTLYRFPTAHVVIGLMLRAELAGRDETYVAGAEVAGDGPDGPLKHPLVQVADDGGSGVWPIVETPLIRVTIWHPGGEGAACDLAQLCRAILLDHSSDEIPAIRYGTSITTALDSEFGDHLATFTVNATTRSVAL